MLSIDTKMDREMIKKIYISGHSRLPIYEKEKANIIGLIFSKDLVILDQAKKHSVKNMLSMFSRKYIILEEDTPCESALQQFKRDRVHMAVVVRGIPKERNSEGPTLDGIKYMKINEFISSPIFIELRTA